MSDTLLQEIPSHFRGRRFTSAQDRRQFLATLGLGGLFFTTRGAFAQALTLTPEQTLGPYYPDVMPLDRDNDLLVINDAITPSVGTITWVTGRVLDQNGQPVRNALVEIWQADNNGAYIHSRSPIANRDRSFQGYGRFLTASDGRYLFRTVKPGLYPGRTRHIHYAITAPGRSRLTTQLYVAGETLNNTDGVLNGIRDAAQKASVITQWSAIPSSAIGELATSFDVVLGYNSVDASQPARPTLVSMSGVVNSGSFYPGVAAGSWVTLFGKNLSPVTRSWGAGDFSGNQLPKTLDGVSVSINNQPASVSYVSPTQINVQAPAMPGSGTVQVSVTSASGNSDPVSVQLRQFMPSFFTIGQEYVAGLRLDGAYLGPAGLIEGLATVAAKPGDVIALFGTGFGPTNPDVPAGETFSGAAPLVNPFTIQIDNTIASVSFGGLASPGVYQFNLSVPDLPDGDHAVTASVGGVRTEKIARLRIQRQTSAALRKVKSPGSLKELLARLPAVQAG